MPDFFSRYSWPMNSLKGWKLPLPQLYEILDVSRGAIHDLEILSYSTKFSLEHNDWFQCLFYNFVCRRIDVVKFCHLSVEFVTQYFMKGQFVYHNLYGFPHFYTLLDYVSDVILLL